MYRRHDAKFPLGRLPTAACNASRILCPLPLCLRADIADEFLLRSAVPFYISSIVANIYTHTHTRAPLTQYIHIRHHHLAMAYFVLSVYHVLLFHTYKNDHNEPQPRRIIIMLLYYTVQTVANSSSSFFFLLFCCVRPLLCLLSHVYFSSFQFFWDV